MDGVSAREDPNGIISTQGSFVESWVTTILSYVCLGLVVWQIGMYILVGASQGIHGTADSSPSWSSLPVNSVSTQLSNIRASVIPGLQTRGGLQPAHNLRQQGESTAPSQHGLV